MSQQHLPRQAQVFEQFLETLRGASGASLTLDTTLGAITHYLSTLPINRTSELVEAILVWSARSVGAIQEPEYGLDRLREAVRVAVPGRLARIHSKWHDERCSAHNERRAAQKWLAACTAALRLREGNTRMILMHGLLQGIVEEGDVDWGSERTWLEQQITLDIVAAMNERQFTRVVESAAHIMPSLPSRVLRVLPLPAIANLLFRELCDHLGQDGDMADRSQAHLTRITSIAAALGRAMTALGSNEGGIPSQCLTIARGLCHQIRDAPSAHTGRAVRSPAREQRVLIALLQPGHSIISALLASSELETLSTPSGVTAAEDLAILLLTTLSSLEPPVQDDSALCDQYERVIQGCTNLLAVNRHGRAIGELFRHLHTGIDQPRTAAFSLDVGRRLIDRIDGPTFVDRCMPLTSYVLDSNHQSAFEKSHALIVRMLDMCVSRSQRGAMWSQRAAFEELIPYYAQVVITQFRKDLLERSYLEENYPRVVAAASAISVTLADSIMALLQPPSQDSNNSLLLVRIACIPRLPGRRIIPYLDQCGREIMALNDPQRTDPVAALRKTIAEVPDYVRPAALRWWMAWDQARETSSPTRPYLYARL